MSAQAEAVEPGLNWRNLCKTRWYLDWQEKTCELSERENYFLQLLAAFRGRPVDYVDIAEECWENNCVSGERIRRAVKRRLGRKLELARHGRPCRSHRHGQGGRKDAP